VALEAPFDVPIGLAVTDEEELGHGSLR